LAGGIGSWHLAAMSITATVENDTAVRGIDRDHGCAAGGYGRKPRPLPARRTEEVKVFADTYFYLALFNARDAHDRRVVEFVAAFAGGVVTTQWVLTEVADAFARIPQRRELRAKFRVLGEDAETHIVGASPELFERGLALYDDRPDKEWSLTDCISFVAMGEEGLTEALTGDRHFKQAGFKALLVRRRAGSNAIHTSLRIYLDGYIMRHGVDRSLQMPLR